MQGIDQRIEVELVSGAFHVYIYQFFRAESMLKKNCTFEVFGIKHLFKSILLWCIITLRETEKSKTGLERENSFLSPAVKLAYIKFLYAFKNSKSSMKINIDTLNFWECQLPFAMHLQRFNHEQSPTNFKLYC